MRIGVDIGGTFIDFCAFDPQTGEVSTLKVLTTPDRPGEELLDGLRLLEERYAIAPPRIESFVHGTTIGINTVIQRKGSRLALLTTAGFEDVVELARLRMPEMYSLFCSRPEQLISRDLIFGIDERILSDGSVATELDVAAIATAVERARAGGAEGIIVSFLHSYRNPRHESEVKRVIGQLDPALFVFTSSEVWPVIREYERTTTAILNGYVHPRVSKYLGSLDKALKARGVPAQPLLTKSNGGVMNIETGKTNCVSMLLSGTASGVMGAAYIAQQAQISQVLTLDIGGTSADLALIIDGKPQFGMGETIGDFPLFVPSVSVTSIGSGGGSIAWVDDVGVLKVGPESAGSVPGPACYGRGGTRPTVTDAMVVCGLIGQVPLAYNQIRVDADLALQAVTTLAERLDRTPHQAAEAIVQIAVSEMFVEVNKLIARFGVDPRDFALMPFGGAGPMLGCFLAQEVGIDHVIVPRRPGVVSALGGLVADVKGDFIKTIFVPIEVDALPTLRTALTGLRETAERWLRVEQRFAGAAISTMSADMRYHGQSFEIEVALQADWIESGTLGALRDAFHAAHHALYDFNDPSGEVEIVNLRLVIAGANPRPILQEEARVCGQPTPDRQIEVWLDGAFRQVPLYDRAALRHGHVFQGPAVVSQEDATLCIPPGFSARVDAQLNLHLVREAA